MTSPVVPPGSMIPRDRIPYSAIVDRPPLRLPNDGRIIVWTIVNLEVWDISRPMARQVIPPPTGASLLPDVPNWSWHEYGMRVGVWRFFDLYARLGLVAAAARDAGWEFMGHGWLQEPMHRLADQAATIARAVAAIGTFTGRPCTGWLGPGLTQTATTPDLLAAAGIGWTGDFVVDDLPARIATAHGPILALPYSVELNDVPIIALQHGDERELPRRARLQAARLLAEAEAADSVRVMGIAIHPYLSGVPHRIAALEALFAECAADPRIAILQGEAIARWYHASGDPA